MDAIGLLVAGGRSEFYASQLPEPGTLRVTIVHDGITYVAKNIDFPEEVPDISLCYQGDICYEYLPPSNSIRFIDYTPPEQAEVIIEYTALSSSFDDDDPEE